MKIAAFDFDGTLLHSRGDGTHSFNADDLEAIRAWREAGHLAIAATGRSRSALTFGIGEADLTFDYRVLSNGASATTGDDAELIYAYPIDPGILRAAVAAFQDTADVAVFGTTIGPVDGAFVVNTPRKSAFTGHFARFTTDDIDQHTFAVVPIWVPEDETLRADVVRWAQRFEEVTVAQNQDYVDIMAAGRSKGTGILELIQTIGLRCEDVELYTFGDSWNDLSMHDAADISHSFPHSPADVKAATNHVIGAVADVLPRYI